MSLEFTHPYYLIALLLAVFLLWGFRYSLIDFTKAQRWISFLLRLVILSLLVFAIAGLTLMSPTHEKMVVFLLDQSRSIDDAATEKALEFINAAQTTSGNTPFFVVPFASSPIVETADGRQQTAADASDKATPSLQSAVCKLPSEWREATNIAAALEPALALIPPRYVPHLVILSDGNETTGDVLSAAVRGGVAISTVPLPAPTAPEVQMAEIRLPAQVRQGEPFNLDVVVQSNIDTEGLITLYSGAFKVAEETKPLKIGENVFRFRQTVEDRRQQEFSATVAAVEDTILDNNAAAGLVFAGGKPRILLVESDPKTARDLVSALREQDIRPKSARRKECPEHLTNLTSSKRLSCQTFPQPC